VLSANRVIEEIFGPLDPAPEYKYLVEVDGLIEGGFTACSGFRAEREILTVAEGGVNHYVHKLPGRTSYGHLTLKKGIAFSTALWDWYAEGLRDLKVKKRNINIIHYGSYFNIPARWYKVIDAFPVNWSASDLSADSTSVAVESLELAFSYIEPESLSGMALAAKMAMAKALG
jgi:phage tail-like protein